MGRCREKIQTQRPVLSEAEGAQRLQKGREFTAGHGDRRVIKNPFLRVLGGHEKKFKKR
jgi:hypothetical protein